MKKTIFLFVFLLTIIISNAQVSTISGYVKDAETGETLIGANIYDSQSKKGTVANEFGFFSLSLPKDSVHLNISFIGYQTQHHPIYLKSNIQLNISLLTNSALDEVMVTARENEAENTQMSVINIPMQKVKSLPVLLGEQDIIKTIQLLPGVQSGSEGASGLYVRGGGPDQNLILLDGVPIYNASHLFGFFSIFNADAINNVKLIKGGFPARYGGRLSSVLDISMKDGNMKKISGEGSIGLISSKFTLEGPIIKDKTSFIISGRRTYIDALAQPLIRWNDKNSNFGENKSRTTAGYYFGDLNAKINHIFSPTSRLYLSGYYGLDKFYQNNEATYHREDGIEESKDKSSIQWGNKIVALRWNKIIQPKLFLNTTATYSQYKFGLYQENEFSNQNPVESISSNYASEYTSGIRDWTGKLDFSYLPNNKHSIRFGAGNTYHTFTPGASQEKLNDNDVNVLNINKGSNSQYSHEHWIYAEDDWKITARLKINVGLHLSGFSAKEKWYFSPEPRISGRFMLSEQSSIKASYSRMSQNLHLLTNPTIGLPTDLWVPATELVPPEYSDQVALGYSHSFKKGIQLSVEGYYKEMQNLIAYKEGASFLGTLTDWQDKVNIGNGNSYGLEVLLEKKLGKTTGWIGYTLSRSNRQFDELNFGKAYPYKYDRRHDISIAITHKFNQKVDVGIVWVYGSGYATTLAKQKYNGTQTMSNSFDNYLTPIDHIEERNDYRMPSYHRLDIGINFHKQKKRHTRTWSFGLYNAYSRQNAYFLYFGSDENDDLKLNQVSIFPIIPSVSYQIKF